MKNFMIFEDLSISSVYVTRGVNMSTIIHINHSDNVDEEIKINVETEEEFQQIRSIFNFSAKHSSRLSCEPGKNLTTSVITIPAALLYDPESDDFFPVALYDSSSNKFYHLPDKASYSKYTLFYLYRSKEEKKLLDKIEALQHELRELYDMHYL